MLKVWFGEAGLAIVDRIVYVSDYFDAMYEQCWFESDLAKQIIAGVDMSEYIKGEYIESPVLGGISPRDLSTGCKALLILLNMDNVVVSGERMGDNCYPWLFKIAEVKDVTITLCHNVKLEESFELIDMEAGRVVRTGLEVLLNYKRTKGSAFIEP